MVVLTRSQAKLLKLRQTPEENQKMFSALNINFRRNHRRRAAAVAAEAALEEMNLAFEEEAPEQPIRNIDNQLPAIEQQLVPIQQHIDVPTRSWFSISMINQRIGNLLTPFQFIVNLAGCTVYAYIIYNYLFGEEEIEAVIIRRRLFH